MGQYWRLIDIDGRVYCSGGGKHPICKEELALLLAKADPPSDETLEAYAKYGEHHLRCVYFV